MYVRFMIVKIHAAELDIHIACKRCANSFD
jgi:hypothetical protein